jgi:hypothetical protein
MEIQPGDFFYHSQYKTGQVTSVSQNLPAVVEIQFRNRPIERLSSRHLEQSSIKISPQSLRAFAYLDREAAEKMLVEDPVQVIILTLSDFNHFQAKTQQIKDYLVPDFIKPLEWDAWWEKTLPLLKDDARIDTTQSRNRQYGLAQEQRSRAETDYVRFRSNRHFFSPESLAQLARSALLEEKSNQSLSPEHADELKEYLNNIIYLDRYPVSLRLETLFHMQEDQFISQEEYHARLVRLLDQDVRLYDLDFFAARRVIEELQRGNPGLREQNILATGICAEEAISSQVIRWAVHNHDTDLIARMLVIAFTENLTPTGRDTFYQRLRIRLESCLSQLDILLDTHPAWPDIYQAFGDITRCLAAEKPEEIGNVMPAFVRLAAEMERRGAEMQPELASILLESVASPKLPLMFVLKIIDACAKESAATRLKEKIQDYLWSHAEQRQDDLLTTLLGAIDDDPVERAIQVVTLIKQYPNQGLINQAGNIICTYCQKITTQEVLTLIPFLNILHNTPGDFIWRTRLDDLREEAYLAMFQANSDLNEAQDPAIIQAAHRYAQLEQVGLQKEKNDLKGTVIELRDLVEKLERQQQENEVKIGELSSIQGGNPEEARFDERVRILRSFAETAAEYEAFAATQAGNHQELIALIKGMFTILAKNRVRAMEEIGSQAPFTSAKHRLAEPAVIENGEMVTIVERGFHILDHKDQIRLLKPALVKKIDKAYIASAEELNNGEI